MERGWHCYAAVHPQAPYDCLVVMGEGPRRVEIKSACHTKDKGIVCCPTSYNQPYPADSFDYLAVVGPDGQVWMIPGEVACERASISVGSDKYAGYLI